MNDIKDPKEQLGKLEQIFHLGQTPTQLFKTSHPAKRIKPQQDILGFYLPIAQMKTQKPLNLNLLFKSKNSPVIHLSRDQTYIHIICKDLELYSIP